MPALNIKFTDDELAQLRARAKDEGVSMHTLAHDTLVRCTSQAEEDRLVMETMVRIAEASRGLLDRLADK